MSISRAGLLMASAAALALAPRSAGAQTLTKVRLAGVQSDDLTPVCWGIQTGMYQKAGLDIELVAANSGTAATTAVVAGTYELAKGSVVASLVAHLRGLPITIIANGGLWDPKAPNTVAVVAADSPIKRQRDLTGKLGSAAALNDIVTVTFSAWVDKDGGNSKSIKWVEIPNSAEAAAVEQHRVDFCSLNEPMYTAAIEAGKVRTLGSGLAGSAIADHYVLAAYYAHQDFAAKNPDVVRNFARVTYEAATYTNAHPAETVQMMSDITKIPIETFRKIFRAPGATSGDPALLQPVIDVAAKYGNISQGFAAKDIYFS